MKYIDISIICCEYDTETEHFTARDKIHFSSISDHTESRQKHRTLLVKTSAKKPKKLSGHALDLQSRFFQSKILWIPALIGSPQQRHSEA